ncbi:hypothetical protein V1478_002256 [Vespula squamosa]|uniref:Uncharacterized protein n=1 Tax=Vespula squamosa TaxID=30214 RepID=A0ABD2BW43_VESSQ
MSAFEEIYQVRRLYIIDVNNLAHADDWKLCSPAIVGKRNDTVWIDIFISLGRKLASTLFLTLYKSSDDVRIKNWRGNSDVFEGHYGRGLTCPILVSSSPTNTVKY